MDSKLSQWCNGLIEAGWLAAVVAIPLFFNIHSDRVFEPDKLTLLRSIALLMATAWLVKFIDQQGWRGWTGWRWRDDNSIWRMPFVLTVFLLVIVYLISTVFSVTPRVSWAGSYQRLQGTYTTLSYIVVFALTIATMRSRQQVNRLVTAVIITSIPVAFYGVLQHFTLDPLPWGGNVTNRVAGHMGNAIFIAAYLIMAVPLTVARIIHAFTNILSDEELSYADVIRSSIYIFTVAIQLITIYWSGSRGPWLGLLFGVFAFVLIVLVALRNASKDESGRLHLVEGLKAVGFVALGFILSYAVVYALLNAIISTGSLQSLAGPMSSFASFVVAVGLMVVAIFVMIAARKGWRWLWLGWILLAVLLGGWLILFNLPPQVAEPYKQSPLLGPVLNTLDQWRELPRIGRFGTMLEEDEGTGRVRTLIWEGALELVAPHEPLQFPDGESDQWNFLRPLIGYGPEAMYVAYNRFYLPELATVEARNASPDRSHNETLDALVITGGLGFLVWQALYLSVFYYGFRWLGVLRTNFERNLLIALWVGVGVSLAAVFAVWRGPVYIGIALPFGSIAGLILYLIYYALFAPTPEEEVQPFEGDRLLMIGLVTAVLAHYVEIHFGIAIAATRLHFFAYVGLMFIMGYLVPRLQQEPKPAEEPAPQPAGRKRRPTRTAVSSRPAGETQTTAGWGPVILMSLMLALMIGILGYNFVTYSPPPDKVIDSADDLRAGEILYQSLFINARKDFADSPFVFVMMMLTWSLGTLVGLSEMVKNGELNVSAVATKLQANRQQIVGGIFAAMAVASLVLRFALPLPTDAGMTSMLGRGLLLIWAGLCALSAVSLFMGFNSASFLAGMIAILGFLFSLPVMVAGSFVGLVLLVVCLGLIYLLWDRTWGNLLLPAMVMGFLSLSVGLFYGYVQAAMLLTSLVYRTPEGLTDIERRVAEATNASNYLTVFYLFVGVLIFVAASFLAGQWMARVRHSGTTFGYAGLVVAMILCFAAVGITNMRIIQADMVYKRGKPFDDQAGRQRNVQLWDTAIAIYEQAIDMAPKEDFYYLFLGRAYLERSQLSAEGEQEQLLDAAQVRLQEAQNINPLNTDHTANLARLNTRWVELSATESEKQTRLETAERYYQDALKLSPQNSVIRNEYARLLYALKRDCDSSIELYDQSLQIDPYYEQTYFGLADVYVGCTQNVDEATKQDYYAKAATTLEGGLERDGDNPRAWLQAGQIYHQLKRYEEALAAFEQATAYNTRNQVPPFQLEFLKATVYRDMGDVATAVTTAQQALSLAPNEQAQNTIQAFINQLTSPPAETTTP